MQKSQFESEFPLYRLEYESVVIAQESEGEQEEYVKCGEEHPQDEYHKHGFHPGHAPRFEQVSQAVGDRPGIYDSQVLPVIRMHVVDLVGKYQESQASDRVGQGSPQGCTNYPETRDQNEIECDVCNRCRNFGGQVEFGVSGGNQDVACQTGGRSDGEADRDNDQGDMPCRVLPAEQNRNYVFGEKSYKYEHVDDDREHPFGYRLQYRFKFTGFFRSKEFGNDRKKDIFKGYAYKGKNIGDDKDGCIDPDLCNCEENSEQKCVGFGHDYVGDARETERPGKREKRLGDRHPVVVRVIREKLRSNDIGGCDDHKYQSTEMCGDRSHQLISQYHKSYKNEKTDNPQTHIIDNELVLDGLEGPYYSLCDGWHGDQRQPQAHQPENGSEIRIMKNTNRNKSRQEKQDYAENDAGNKNELDSEIDGAFNFVGFPFFQIKGNKTGHASRQAEHGTGPDEHDDREGQIEQTVLFHSQEPAEQYLVDHAQNMTCHGTNKCIGRSLGNSFDRGFKM